jgi:hypothetical protein
MLRIILLIAVLVATATAPAWSQARTTPVEVTNDPTVKIDSTQNTMKIDPANNVVAAPTQSKTILPWASDQTVAAGGWLYTSTIDCRGYKELRVVLKANSTSAFLEANYTLVIRPTPSSSVTFSVGKGNFATATTPLTTQGNFTPASYNCIFTVPVLSDECMIGIYNGTGGEVTMYRWSSIYLVN